MEKIRGNVGYIFFPKTGVNPEQLIQFLGFTVRLTNNRTVSCFGKVTQIEPDDYLELEGDYEDAEKKKFQVKSAIRVDDDEPGALSMMQWLFGKKTGARIVDAFNGSALKALGCFKNRPDSFMSKCKKIRRIGNKAIKKAYDRYEDHIGIDVVYGELASYGIKLNQALKVYTKLGEDCLSKIEKNPYILSTCGVQFPIVDKIATNKYEVAEDDDRRILAGAMQAMSKVQSAGHCYIRLNSPCKNTQTPDIKSEISKTLSIKDETLINDGLIHLEKEDKLFFERHRGKMIVYTPEMKRAEEFTAKSIVSRLRRTNYSSGQIEKFISEFEKENFQLADLQRQAVETSVKNQFSIISGPPGSGKTTIINVIVSMLKDFNPKANILMCSPTGKAAQRMKESTGEEASTIHRLLSYNPVDKKFNFNAENQLDCDIIVVDEFSMCGIGLFCSLLEALPKRCQVILVGDKDQLPSIDPGKVLEDLLNLEFIPKTILNKVYRQKDGSKILKDALAIGNEDLEEIVRFEDAEDVKFHQSNDLNRLQNDVVEHFLEAVKLYGLNEVCILTPMNKGDLGTVAFNNIIQSRLHPFEGEDREIRIGKERCFRVHDRVIQIKNEPDFEVFNGDVGTIISIEKADKTLGIKDTITVDFGNDIVVEYSRDRFENLKLAYSITIHKSQGSEYKNVLMILDRSHNFMLKKKLVYTGWTRAKARLDIFGQKQMIAYSINNKEINRNSKLRKNIRTEFENVSKN